MKRRSVSIGMFLPVTVELEVEMIDDDTDFDVKAVHVLPIQNIGVSDVNENLDDDLVAEVMKLLEAQKDES